MSNRVSGLMARLQVAERLDNGKVVGTQVGQDYGKVTQTGGAGKMLRNVEIASTVTTMVTTPAAPLVANREVASQVATGLTPAANDHDRRMAALWRHPCGSCTLRRTPGTARPGYCIGRDDLPLAYGLLHVLPADLGNSCDQYNPIGRT